MLEAKEHEIPVVEVSRAFPYAFRTPQNILTGLDKYLSCPNGEIPIIEVYLAHKTKESKYSANYLAPIGGKMLQGESVLKTAYRRIHEESTLVCSPIKENEDSRFSIEGSFTYNIICKDMPPEKRRTHFSVVPVVNPQLITSIYPIQEDSKIDGFVGLSVKELTEAFDSGMYTDINTNETFPLQGHITKLKNAPDTNLTRQNILKRTKMLNEVMHTLKQQELKARNALYYELVFLAVTKMGFSKKELLTIDKLEELVIKFKNIFGDNFNQFFTEAYSAVLGHLYMNYFRNQEEKSVPRPIKEKKGKQNVLEFLKRKKEKPINNILFYEARIIKEKMINGNFSLDVLHFLPLLINMEQIFKGKTTHLIIELARFMRDLTKEIAVEGPYKNINSLKEFFLNQNILLEEKLEYNKKFDKQLINVLAKVFQIDQRSIIDAWAKASRYIPDLAEETRYADPELSKLYQFHELRDEVSNSSLGQAFLLSLGVDLKNNGTDWSIIKFEALRQLAFFLKILFVSPIYENIVKKKPHPVDLAINNFFGSVIDNKIITLISNGTEKKMPITYRKSLDGDIFIVDEKPVKSLESVVRKSLEENTEDIVDIQSCSIVLPEDIYDHLEPEKRIKFVNQQIGKFITFIASNYPNWQVEIMKDENTFDNYRKVIKNQQVSDGGKRTGSKGDLIIRRKIKLKMIDKNSKESYKYELVFYPFEEFKSESYQDVEPDKINSLMGWKKKIEDNPHYSFRRLIYPLRGALGLKSIYELLFPPSLYPKLIEQMRKISVNVYEYSS